MHSRSDERLGELLRLGFLPPNVRSAPRFATVVGHCLHDTTLWERLSLDLLPEAERIIVAARRAATTPRRDFPDRRSGRITAHLPDCDPSSTVRCKLSARKSEAICCAELSRLPSPIAPITLSDPPPTSRAAGQGLAAVPLPSNSGSLAMLMLRSWPSLTSRVRVTTVWALRPGDDHRND